jgi:hypothetical protein
MSLVLKNFVLVATYVSPGVKVDAGGFVIINGKIVKVPPRGPEYRQLQAALDAIAARVERSG